MKRAGILETGPLVALLNRREVQHGWVKEQLRAIEPPLLTCEAVISETCFLLRGVHGGQQAVMETLEVGLVRLAFDLAENIEPVEELMARYASVPMSLADACLVRTAERMPESPVLRFDKDFYVDRKNRTGTIAVLLPDELN